jgi:hypothetical protein
MRSRSLQKKILISNAYEILVTIVYQIYHIKEIIEQINWFRSNWFAAIAITSGSKTATVPKWSELFKYFINTFCCTTKIILNKEFHVYCFNFFSLFHIRLQSCGSFNSLWLPFNLWPHLILDHKNKGCGCLVKRFC